MFASENAQTLSNSSRNLFDLAETASRIQNNAMMNLTEVLMTSEQRFMPDSSNINQNFLYPSSCFPEEGLTSNYLHHHHHFTNIRQDENDNLFLNVHTGVSQYDTSLKALTMNCMDKQEQLSKYGHLDSSNSWFLSVINIKFKFENISRLY